VASSEVFDETQSSDGVACASGAECATGNCVDGVCCDSPCTGQCEACDLPGSGGTCSPVLGLPRGARPACVESGNLCTIGECTGEGRASCSLIIVDCFPVFCIDGVLTVGSSCNGSGGCTGGTQTSCGDYACADFESCRTDCAENADCAAGRVCEAGACKATTTEDGGAPIDAGPFDGGSVLDGPSPDGGVVFDGGATAPPVTTTPPGATPPGDAGARADAATAPGGGAAPDEADDGCSLGPARPSAQRVTPWLAGLLLVLARRRRRARR
jgi:hypothetical protein